MQNAEEANKKEIEADLCKLGSAVIASASNDFSIYPELMAVRHVFLQSNAEGFRKLGRARKAAVKELGIAVQGRERDPGNAVWWNERACQATSEILRIRHNIEQTPTVEERNDFVRDYSEELTYVSKIRWSGLVNMASRTVLSLLEQKFPDLKQKNPAGLKRSLKVWAYFTAYPNEVDLHPGCLTYYMAAETFANQVGNR